MHAALAIADTGTCPMARSYRMTARTSNHSHAGPEERQRLWWLSALCDRQTTDRQTTEAVLCLRRDRQKLKKKSKGKKRKGECGYYVLRWVYEGGIGR